MTDDPMYQRTGVQSAEPRHLREAPRCGAKTRSGQPCRSPAVHGRPRCRMHGCAPGAGGPAGKRNGNYRHGLSTNETRMRLQVMRDLTREVKEFTKKVRGAARSP